MPREEVVLEDIFGWKTQAWITGVEYQLASKITFKVGRDFGDDPQYNIHDTLKAVLDLRLLKYVDRSKVRSCTGPSTPKWLKRTFRHY